MWPIVTLGGLRFSTYGILVTLGYLAGAVWLRCNFWNMRTPARRFWALGFTLVLGALTGAKLGFWIVERRAVLQNPGWYLRHWKSGWVFWTGFLASILSGWAFQRVYNRFFRPRRFLPVADYFGAALPLGHSLGRLACFAEGCCYGRPTGLPWGVRFTQPISEVALNLRGVPLHPVQLYEAAGVLAISLFNMRYVLPRIRAKRFRYGTAFLGYIFLYSALRFLMEFFRGDPRGELLWAALSPSQWISLGALAASGTALWRGGILERDPESRSIYL